MGRATMIVLVKMMKLNDLTTMGNSENALTTAL